jgi:hypothetical protein
VCIYAHARIYIYICMMHACMYVCMYVSIYLSYTNNPAYSHSTAEVTRILSVTVILFYLTRFPLLRHAVRWFIHSAFSRQFCRYSCIYPVTMKETFVFNSITSHLIPAPLCDITQHRNVNPYRRLAACYRSIFIGQVVQESLLVLELLDL